MSQKGYTIKVGLREREFPPRGSFPSCIALASAYKKHFSPQLASTNPSLIWNEDLHGHHIQKELPAFTR